MTTRDNAKRRRRLGVGGVVEANFLQLNLTIMTEMHRDQSTQFHIQWLWTDCFLPQPLTEFYIHTLHNKCFQHLLKLSIRSRPLVHKVGVSAEIEK